jgi:L-fuculose-phosphate aldolase
METYWLKKLIRVGGLLYIEGLVDARAGNLSCLLDDHILITRRGSHLGLLGEWDFIRVPVKVQGALTESASSELPVHLEVYGQTSHRAIVHAHPISTVILSMNLERIKPRDEEGKALLGEVSVLPPYPSGSPQLAKAVAQALKSGPLVIVRGHGVFSADRDPFYAYAHISVLERSCKILLHGGLQGL